MAKAVSRAVADEQHVLALRVEEGQPPGGGVLRVVLGLPAGLPGDVVEAVATRVGERLATDGEFRARVDKYPKVVGTYSHGGKSLSLKFLCITSYNICHI